MRKYTLIFTFFVTFSMLAAYSAPAFAVMWYDTLPENKEVAPKAGSDGAVPNYSGSVDFQTENPITPNETIINTNTEGEVPGKGVTQPSVAIAKAPLGDKLYSLLVGGIIIVVLLVGGWLIRRAQRQ